MPFHATAIRNWILIFTCLPGWHHCSRHRILPVWCRQCRRALCPCGCRRASLRLPCAWCRRDAWPTTCQVPFPRSLCVCVHCFSFDGRVESRCAQDTRRHKESWLFDTGKMQIDFNILCTYNGVLLITYMWHDRDAAPDIQTHSNSNRPVSIFSRIHSKCCINETTDENTVMSMPRTDIISHSHSPQIIEALKQIIQNLHQLLGRLFRRHLCESDNISK